MPRTKPDLGAPDPELRNSPVAWESDEDTEALREAVPGDAVCYFNGVSYAEGTLIRSGASILRCDSGLWVPESTGD